LMPMGPLWSGPLGFEATQRRVVRDQLGVKRFSAADDKLPFFGPVEPRLG
jgi:hypothetical protein